MDWFTNEMLFYGGMIISAFALVSGIIYGFISHIVKLRLREKLRMEYGDAPERKRELSGNLNGTDTGKR